MSDRGPTVEPSCAHCGAAAAEGARFCSGCGRPIDIGVATRCPACEESNPRHARFCLRCGASLDSVADADRRVVTVVFADLSGFTALTERMDPEEIHRLIGGCLDRVSEPVSRWGGFVDKFIGDCVMALFGAPVAYENEPERAVRAALEMHEALEGWAEEHADRAWGAEGDRPQLRIGVNTGPVVTGVFVGGGARDYTAIGDTVNVAARLQSLCEPGRILVGPRTHEATRHLFEYDAPQVLEIRGRREPVEARHVRGLQPQRGTDRGFQGRRVQLIGRTDELDTLRRALNRTREGRPEVILLIGPAGIGKSRLVRELISAELSGPGEVAAGHSYPHASSTPWEPIAELLRGLHDIPKDTSPADTADRIARAADAAWSHEGRAALRVALGAPVSDVPELSGYDPAERLDRVAAAVTRALRESTRDAPRLLLLEDLHWADRTTLEFLGGLEPADLAGPALMILVSRPPLPGEAALARLLEAFPDSVALEPLAREHVRQLLDALLEPHDLPDPLVERIIERAGGNPLYVEETLKSLVGTGALHQDDGVWRARDDAADLRVPDTIESVLTSRIDALEPAAKRVLQCAAVVGRRFWSGVLSDALMDRPVDREIGQLVEGAFVRPRPTSAVRGQQEYVFQHLLLQEVTYEGMLRELRTDLHGSVAGWLEAHVPENLGDRDEWIAYHYERSTDPERAVPFLERAALRSRERGSLGDARTILERALEVARAPEPRVRLLALAETIAAASADPDWRRALVDDLWSLAGETGDDRALAEATFRKARLLLDQGDLPAARADGDRALTLYRKLEDPSMEADVLRLLGRVSHLRGDYPEALTRYRASLPLEHEAGDRHGQAEVFDRLGLVQLDIGDFTTALDYFDAARELCSELNVRSTEAQVLSHKATALHWLGADREAAETARTALDLAERCGAHRAATSARLPLAMALGALGELDEARTAATEVRERAREQGRPGLEARAWLAIARIESGEAAAEAVDRAIALARQQELAHVEIQGLARDAELALAADDPSRADRSSAMAVEMLDRRGNLQGPEEAIFYIRARALRACDRAEEAETMLDRARAVVREKARHIEDPGLRRHYLEEVDLNRAILEGSEHRSRPASA